VNPPSLSELQAWFLTAIMTPGGVTRGLALAQERHGLAEHEVLRGAAGTVDASGSRLHIYADGYVLRLLECMRADYPVLCRTMGRELFDFFAKAYVWRHPSRSSTLYDLGAGFADFLAASRPAGASAEAAQQFAFPAQLARLERALAEAGRAPGLEKLAATAADGFSLLSGTDAMLGLAPCTRLLELSFPLHAYWQQAAGAPADAAPPAMPAFETTWLAVGRLHYRVGMQVLAPWQFHFLRAAAERAPERAPARECALRAARACGLPAGRVLADALLWLPLAAAAALVTLEQANA
jgi:hypothetical protein